LDNLLKRHAIPRVCPTCSSRRSEILRAAGIKEDDGTPRRGRKRKVPLV
jgi:hypothetical protein